MLELLRSWLNGSREYDRGVTLYLLSGHRTYLQLFRIGETKNTGKKLESELLRIFRDLQACADTEEQASLPTQPAPAPPLPVIIQNEDLYSACIKAAELAYKEVMNLRAELFALSKPESYPDPNEPALVSSRGKMAVKVVEGYNNVSRLYEKADFVKEHGRLPDESAVEENEYEHLPDHLVKQTLDNIRKNMSKLRKKQQTPERIALLQRHEENIEKLSSRWNLLKPRK